MRHKISLNQDWLFRPECVGADVPDTQFERVTLPHTNKLFSHLSVDNAAYQFVSTYRRHLSVARTAGQRVFVDFEGAMLKSTVLLNGVRLGEHKGGFTPFSFDLTEALTDGDNVLTVYVDATEDRSIPPYGGQVDYLTFGGLYREVSLRVVESCHIASVFARPLDVLRHPALVYDVQVSAWTPNLSLEASLHDAHGQPIAQQNQLMTAQAATFRMEELNGITLWSLDNPTLYSLRLRLMHDGQALDEETVRIGFRSAEFCDDGRFMLNGVPLKLFGLNRHQTYAYLGAAAPARLQRMDAEILKYELGCNIVRTSHYAQSRHFLDRCDEIGLLVFEELAGWQHIGDETWQDLAAQDLQAMIERDRHHPSIILWGVRINESPDSDAFYTRTNALAHRLDGTRQTGGVRTFLESSFLEDVFTLNDFPPGLQDPRVRPHLVTEFVGHMFPTKSWDNEERRLEHALHHAHKHNLHMGHPDVAGGIGWCAFDYHTHKDFGSGDRICYHGVMDMHRLPKMAAFFYRSQTSSTDEIVLHAATNWTMGDRSGGGNNPLVVFSNCDEVEIIIGDTSYARLQPHRAEFPHLRHPPFILRWPEPYNPWGTPFHDLTVRGFIGGVQVAEQIIDASHTPAALRLSPYTDHLAADGVDMTRVAVQIVDKYGNVLPYHVRIVHFRLEGDATLIGENPLALLGGQAACYLKSGTTAGRVTLQAWVDGLPAASTLIHIGD